MKYDFWCENNKLISKSIITVYNTQCTLSHTNVQNNGTINKSGLAGLNQKVKEIKKNFN